MLFTQRQHIRFSLDIPAVRRSKFGDQQELIIRQISIGGCLAELDEHVYTGDEFRIELELPNKNRLPLCCKVIYLSEDNGIGIKFSDVTRFEQELIAKIITNHLEKNGLPVQVNPFAQPPKVADANRPQLTDQRRQREEMLERIMSGNSFD